MSEKPQLYHIATDITESTNLAESESKVAEKMAERLEEMTTVKSSRLKYKK